MCGMLLASLTFLCELWVAVQGAVPHVTVLAQSGSLRTQQAPEIHYT